MNNAKALGIIFPNMHDHNIPELVAHRTMASIPFGGRYRMIDFCLSGMASAGMQNVGVIARQNYQSLMDHLGSGREWDLSRKRGGLVVFPPYARDGSEMYNGRIEALASVMNYLEYWQEDLVIMCDCNVAYNLDFSQLINAHYAAGADITAVYEKGVIEEGMQRDNTVFSLNKNGFVNGIRLNDYRSEPQNMSLNIYVVGRRFLIDLVKDAMVRGHTRFEKDILAENLDEIKLFGYEYCGYSGHIYDMRSYFEESLRLLERKNLEKLFPEDMPVYTKVRDEAPVRYAIDARTSDTMVADGCIIEGEVKNCVLFRGVRIGKGAKLKDCVIMQGTEVRPGAVLENVITDKNVIIGAGQMLRGARNFPVFIAKGSHVL